jgi:hypothetical protein
MLALNDGSLQSLWQAARRKCCVVVNNVHVPPYTDMRPADAYRLHCDAEDAITALCDLSKAAREAWENQDD